MTLARDHSTHIRALVLAAMLLAHPSVAGANWWIHMTGLGA